MEKEKCSFDRTIWRINGILILGVFLAAAIVTLFTDYNLFTHGQASDYYSSAINRPTVALDEETGNYLYLGQFRTGSSGEHASAPLYSGSEKRRGRHIRSSGVVRNYYYYDSATGEGTWLFENNNNLIRDRQNLNEGGEYRRRGDKMYGYLYTVVDADSDKDGSLTERDGSSIYISGPSGKDVKKLLDNVDTVLGSEVLDSGKLFLYTQEKDGDFIYQVSLDNFNILKKTKIEIK